MLSGGITHKMRSNVIALSGGITHTILRPAKPHQTWVYGNEWGDTSRLPGGYLTPLFAILAQPRGFAGRFETPK